MKKTTLCYIQVGDSVLMLHRTKKKNDENAGKYIGLGGHFLPGETPEECMLREVQEESGLTLPNYAYRGIVYFRSDMWQDEEMHLFTAKASVGDLPVCNEGDLYLVKKEELQNLPMWVGDRIFLSLLFDGAPFFRLELVYEGERLVRTALNGQTTEFFDLLNEKGEKTGRVKERTLVHRDGDRHGTAHIWIYRIKNGLLEFLLQKRSENKDSFPGCYDISSAGHLSAGDDFFAAAKRELKEELGLSVQESALEFLCFMEQFKSGCFHRKPFKDLEYTSIYILDGRGIDISQLTLQKEELDEVRWFSSTELAQKTEDPCFCLVKEELQTVTDAIKNKKI